MLNQHTAKSLSQKTVSPKTILSHPKNFAPIKLCSKYFLSQKMFCPINFLSQQNFCPKIWWSRKILASKDCWSQWKYCSQKMLALRKIGPKKIIVPTKFCPIKTLVLKVYGTQKILVPKNVLSKKILMTDFELRILFRPPWGIGLSVVLGWIVWRVYSLSLYKLICQILAS